MDRVSTRYLVIHCADTPPSMDIGVKEIRQWHTSPDPKDSSKPWSDVGYHFIIRRNGAIENGRDIKIIGSHVKGFNSCSIGVCMVGGMGGNNFNAVQWDTLAGLVKKIKMLYPKISVLGHRDLNIGKTCPNFNVAEWLKKTGV